MTESRAGHSAGESKPALVFRDTGRTDRAVLAEEKRVGGFIQERAGTQAAEEPEAETVSEVKAEEEPAEEIPAEEEEAEVQEAAEEDAKKDRKVKISSSQKSVMKPGEMVKLTSSLEGFEDCEEISYQWEVDKGDGFEAVAGATSDSYSFEATKESLGWSWRLSVTCR